MTPLGMVGRVGVLWAVLAGAPTAHAVLFVVDDTAPTTDANAGDGICADSLGRCTWPAAVRETNVLVGPDVIALPAGTYAGQGVAIADDLEVVGQGVGSTVLDGEGARRLVSVDGVVVVMRGITLTGGADSPGAAILNEGDLTVLECAFTANTSSFIGGAVATYDTLTVERTTFSANSATAGAAIFSDAGGVTVRSSTFLNNASAGNASAIHSQTGATLLLENTTIVAGLGGPAVIFAGGASGVITHATIASNESSGLTVNTGTSVTIANTIVANNGIGMMFTDDCFAPGTVTSLGGNLSSDTSCNFDDVTDLETTEPGLVGLSDNGGPTQTAALAMGSPALDTAAIGQCLPTDQRGAPRPAGGGCDRGAHENDGIVPPTTTTTFPTTTTSTSSSTSTSSTTTLPSTTSTSTTLASSTTTVTTTSSTTSTSIVSTTTTTSTSLPSTTTSSVVSTTSSTTTTLPSTTSTSTTLASSTTIVSSTSTTTSTTIVSTTTTTLPAAATLVLGRKLLVKQTKSGVQRLRLIVKDAAVAGVVPCDVDGELVIEAIGAGAPAVRFGLDASLWRPIKKRRPEKGCKYRKGPVVVTVLVKSGKSLKVIATADDFGIPLATDPRPVRIEVRHGARRHCAEFGGEGRLTPDRRLLAKRAGAATECPAGEAQGGAVSSDERPR